MGLRDLFIGSKGQAIVQVEPCYFQMIEAAMDSLAKAEHVSSDQLKNPNIENRATVQCLNPEVLRRKISDIATRNLESFNKYHCVNNALINGYIKELKKEILKCSLSIFEKGSKNTQSDKAIIAEFAERKADHVVNLMLYFGARRNVIHSV